MPLVVAHKVIDIISSAGFQLAVAWRPEIFAPVLRSVGENEHSLAHEWAKECSWTG